MTPPPETPDSDAQARAPIARGPGFDRRIVERAYFADHPGRARTHRRLVGRLQAMGLEEGRVLDVGCGAGYTLRALAEAGFEAEGIDHSGDALDLASFMAPGAKTVEGDVDRGLPWPDESFDAIVLRDVLERLADPETVVEECLRTLRPGGRVLVSTANGRGLLARILGRRWSFYRDPTHRQAFDLASLVALFGYRGFAIEDWGSFFDLNQAGDRTPSLRFLRRFGWVLPGAGLGERLFLVARRPQVVTVPKPLRASGS